MAKIPLHKAKLFAGRIEPVTIYRLGATGVLRAVSNLTGERVKKDPKFRRTMANAAVLGRASRIGSFVYRELPKEFRQFWMYKAFTGDAIQLLRQGKTDKEAQDILWKTYAEVWVIKGAQRQQPGYENNLFYKKTAQPFKRNKIIQVSPMPSIFSLPFHQHRYKLPVSRRNKKKLLFTLPP